MHTSAPTVLETIPSNSAGVNKSVELYSLGTSPICIEQVKLSLSNYPFENVKNELINGITHGFKLQYQGPRIPMRSRNSNSVSEHPQIVLEKIKKEVDLGRVAGPFDYPPFPTFRISPIFLATKKNGDFRLIHNLSYPANNSVNDFTDRQYCSVRYSSIDDAVEMVKRIGIGGKLAKADIKSAFRLLRISPSDFDQLGFSFQGKYYFDKCLPFGASISCSLFEKFSSALHWYLEKKSGNRNILHYLDDFLFGSASQSSECADTLEVFRQICKSWGVPLAEDKTVEPVEILTFLGIDFDTLKMELRLPSDKLNELKQTLEFFIQTEKVTLRQLQSLIGMLNFACQAVVPGRAFCRRLIDATCNIQKPHYRIRVTNAMREDLQVWVVFLSQYNGVSVMLDSQWTSNDAIQLYTDSAGGKNRGIGIYFQGRYIHEVWPSDWADLGILKDITFLEIFPVFVVLHIWGPELKNKKIMFNIDNMSVVHIINKKSSKSERVMALLRRLVLLTLQYNLLIKAQHIPGKVNQIADSLSRGDFQRFRNLCPAAEPKKTEIPTHLWRI